MYGHTHSPALQQQDPDSLNDLLIPCDALDAEFQLAARASEMYPRNYHAWLHRYICVQCLISRALDGTSGALDALHSEFKASQRWVELHVSDHTAVHYLSRLVSSLDESNIQIPLSPSPSPDVSRTPATTVVAAEDHPMLSHALSLISAYPKHESLWSYLRLAFTTLRGPSPHHVQCIMDFTFSLCDEEYPGDNSAGPIPAKALVHPILAPGRVENVSEIRKHALHLFIWARLWVRPVPCLFARVLMSPPPY